MHETTDPQRHRRTLETHSSKGLRVWIDLDNTPHASFFRPIVRELEARGHHVVVTARADGQAVALARVFGMAPVVVGGWRGHRFTTKILATAWRAARLLGFGAGRAVDVAVSHGSRPLVLASRTLRLPVVTLYDYEGVSAGLFHRLSDRILVPAAVAAELPELVGARLVGYPGVKEELYLSDFRPTDGFREGLGIREDEVMVLLRPEAETAHYHPGERQPLLEAVLDRLATTPTVHVTLLPRTPPQARLVGALLEARGVTWQVPSPADGRDLIWASDLVVGGGGTMTREAAVLGVPAYSIFQGPAGAVDRALSAAGRLQLLDRPEGAGRIRLERRSRLQPPAAPPGEALLDFVVDQICAAGRRDAGDGKA